MELIECALKGEAFLRESPPEKRGLIVFVHGFLKEPADHISLLDALATDEDLRHYDILPFKYDAGKWSTRDPQHVAEELETAIHTVWQRRSPEKLYVIAHSMGGLIARAALLEGSRKKNPWASAVTRLVLLESTNRGYRLRRWYHKLQLPFARLLGLSSLARGVLVGSRFVVRLRLNWLDTFASEQKTPPETIQLLADQRTRYVVFENDSDDLLSCGRAEQRRVAKVNHYTIAMIATQETKNPEKYMPYAQLKSAMFDPLSLTSVQTPTYPDVKLVAFVVHGIRDYGRWLSALEEEIKKLAPKAVVWKKRYPYFSILNFLFPRDRQKKVNSLIQEYGDHRVVYPNAKFVCAGHSNGTYLLGHAMLDFGSLRFERVFLAGCVLPQEFKWRDIGDQVGSLRNDMANGDVPVGFLCAAIRISPFHQDLGIGGFRGFTEKFVKPTFHETEWVQGRHGAAVATERLPEIASYLVNGQPTQASNPVDAPEGTLAFFSKYARLFGTLILLVLVGLGVLIWMVLSFPADLIVFLVYLMVLFIFLARF